MKKMKNKKKMNNKKNQNNLWIKKIINIKTNTYKIIVNMNLHRKDNKLCNKNSENGNKYLFIIIEQTKRDLEIK